MQLTNFFFLKFHYKKQASRLIKNLPVPGKEKSASKTCRFKVQEGLTIACVVINVISFCTPAAG
jgi:hypothetical protein